MKTNAKELTLMSAKPDENTDENSGGGGGKEPTIERAATSKEQKSNSVPAVAEAKRKVSKTQRVREENVNKTNEALPSNIALEGKRAKPTKNQRTREEAASKNSEMLPTDVSDSSDSEQSNIPFVATAECTSPHEGRQLVHTILPINVETLFNLLFSKSKFLLDFHAMRKSTELIFGDWATNDEGLRNRIVNLTVQLGAAVGPKSSKVTEYQSMRDCSKPGELYSIDVNNVNAGIPYADSFSVLTHYCLVRTVDDHTMLSVHAQVKYKKSVWGVVKGLIEKSTWAGLDDFFGALLQSLQNETCIPAAKGKGRRPRRGTAVQIRPLDDTSSQQSLPETLKHIIGAQTLASHSTPAERAAKVTVPSNVPRWMSLCLLALLCFLVVVNVILWLKLWNLELLLEEDMSNRARLPNLAALKQLPNNHEDWLELLRQQEILHETELKKWYTVLQTAIELLKKTEKTLVDLMFR